MLYELPKKPVQFALCINEFHLLAEIILCHKVEALSTLQIQACNFLQKHGIISRTTHIFPLLLQALEVSLNTSRSII